ncbi:hypothetical protein HID58_044658, partial [Brassica napus]
MRAFSSSSYITLAAAAEQPNHKALAMATKPAKQSVQCFGRKKTAVAVTHCKPGCGLIKLNGSPIELFQPEILRFKIFEPVLLLGKHRFAGVDMRIRVNGGGHTSQDSAGGGSEEVRAEEVWWAWCSFSFPEELPLKQ